MSICIKFNFSYSSICISNLFNMPVCLSVYFKSTKSSIVTYSSKVNLSYAIQINIHAYPPFFVQYISYEKHIKKRFGTKWVTI